MSTKTILNGEQTALVAELVMTYDINPEDILFFENETKPFLMYEANAVLCKQLTDLIQIGVEPVNNSFADSITVKCLITDSSGREHFHFGVVNLKEQIQGKDLSQQQAIRLASSRALRNVLLSAGIDLIRLHQQQNGEPGDFKLDSAYNKLNREAHQLGKELFLINGKDKQAWYCQLKNRYDVNHSNELSELQMSDWVAHLRGLKGPSRIAA